MTTADWVVVLEADVRAPEGTLDEHGLRRLLEVLPDLRPVALHSRERYALQVQVAAREEAEALGLAVAHWRGALAKLGMRNTRLIRAEVLTLEEFDRDCNVAYQSADVPRSMEAQPEVAKTDRLGHSLLWQVFHDPLTQLPALGLFMNHVEQALMRTRDVGREPCVLVLKLPGFGTVNERWGRAVGDEVLLTCARRLRSAVPHGVTAARIGGDEFALLVEAAAEHAAELAAAALRSLSEPVDVGDLRISISAGAGIATGRRAQDADKLVAEARSAAFAVGETPSGIEVYRPGLAKAEPASPLPGIPHDPLGYLLLLQRAAMAANESSSLPHAAGLVVSQVCAHIGWQVGHLYELAADGGLVPGGIVHPATHRFRGLLNFLEQLSLRAGEGLAGRVVQTGLPAWVTDIGSEGSLPWRSIASGCGLNAAFAFPVLLGREVVGVLEFFTMHAGPPDDTITEVLRSVGSQLGRVVERRRSQANLRASEDRLREAQALAQLGSWYFDGTRGKVTWSPEMCDILGVPHRGPHTKESFLALVDPDDRELVDVTLNSAGETDRNGPVEFRIRRPDGELRWVCARASVSRGEMGSIVGVYGTMLDITHVKVADESLGEGPPLLNMAERVAPLGGGSHPASDDGAGT